MKNRLVNLLLSIALKDVASLLRFLGKLELKLADFIVAQEKEIELVEAEITHLQSEKAALAGDLSLAQALRNGVGNLRG